MKVAIDIREAGKGKTGKGWYNYNIVKELLKLDNNNQYLLYTNKVEELFDKKKNVDVRVIKDGGLKWHFKVLKDIKSEKVDTFVAPTSYIIPSLAPKTIKTIITVHDLVAFLFPKNHKLKATLIERITLKHALKKASSICVVSENTERDLLKKFKYPEDKIFLTKCAPAELYRKNIPKKELEEFKEKMSLPDNFILGVGTLEPRKNFSTLIKSFVIVKRKHPEYKLVIVGNKGWKYHIIEETLKKYDLQDSVVFPGYLNDTDLQKVYHLAKVFVFPSLYEGFGIPPLEAMSSGCPVVSSNVASLPEVIGEAGLLIDPLNAYKMADAISSLITNEPVRQMLIERGYQQAEKFDWKESAEVLLKVIENLKPLV